MTSIDLTARGSGYYVVYVNDAKFSQHTAEREAVERVTDILAADPSVRVHYTHEYVVDAVPSGDAATLPTSTSAPVSDAGEDFFDFIDRVDGEETIRTTYTGMSFEESLQVFGESTKTGWKIDKLYVEHPDGSRSWGALGWRGYVLVIAWRDKDALRVGVTSAST